MTIQLTNEEIAEFGKVGNLIEKGKYAEAVGILEKYAEKGFMDAQYGLGEIYENGECVQKNMTKATKWYKKAAKQGSALACNRLGAYYLDVKKDNEEGIKWLKMAAERNYPIAQYNLGRIFLGRKKYTQAFAYFKAAANNGFVPAQNSLAVMYNNGEGVETNYEQAVFWLEQAVAQGDVAAMFNLGIAYAHGRGVVQNDEKAAELYQLAADKGDADAQCNLAAAYKNGRGVPRNSEKARYWYQQAAKQNHPIALMQLGVFPLGLR